MKKEIKFKVKFDEEFKDYYFTPFKNDRNYYVWLNDIFETNKGLYAITDDYGDIKIKEYNYEYVIVEVE
jgi:hypothetical protein